MPGIFDSKYFNPEVFGQYMETVPRIKQNAFLSNGIFRVRPELKTMMVDQTGGNFITLPMVGLIGGTPENYDGNTNITASSIGTYYQSMIAYGRAHAWTERDFTADITGHNFLEEAGKQIAGYWDDIQQGIVLSVLKGIYAMATSNAGGFVAAHTYTTKALGAATLNNAITKAVGANKGIFRMAIMNSVDQAKLEELKLVDYAKYTDANGVQADTTMTTWNGRTVLVDDDVPVNTIYLLGEGAFDYCDLGARVPYETNRDPYKNGGMDALITRERKLIAPRGISFVQPSTAIVSPTNAELETAARWNIVKDTAGTACNHKAIPIAKIVVDSSAETPDGN